MQKAIAAGKHVLYAPVFSLMVDVLHEKARVAGVHMECIFPSTLDAHVEQLLIAVEEALEAGNEDDGIGKSVHVVRLCARVALENEHCNGSNGDCMAVEAPSLAQPDHTSKLRMLRAWAVECTHLTTLLIRSHAAQAAAFISSDGDNMVINFKFESYVRCDSL